MPFRPRSRIPARVFLLGTVAALWQACAGEPPVEPTTGAIQVTTSTTGEEPDPNGYTLLLDGTEVQPIGTAATVTLAELPVGSHLVGLAGVAANCEVQGAVSRNAAVTAADTVAELFTVLCPTPSPTRGSLAVTISGLPDGTSAEVTVIGPEGYEARLTASTTLDELAPGTYTVSAASVASGNDTYTPSPESSEASVTAGNTAEAAVTYTAEPRPSLNLRIDGLHLTQSAQRAENDVPLVAGRDAFLRVFVLANEANTVAPSVRVRLYEGATLRQTLTIDAPGSATPTERAEGDLSSSWNATLPASLIGAGLRILVDVDPTDAIAEADDGDNQFPTAGGPETVTARSVPTLALTLVPVRQSANELQGDVTTANRDQYLDLARRMLPLPGYDADVHAPFTTAGPLQSNDGNGAWGVLLSEIDALRIAEGTGREYYGVVRLDYAGGQIARSLTGTPTAVGFDDPAERSRITAHGLGHMWGRDHAPCGNPQALDPNYPYPDGRIGTYGFDVQNQVLKEPTTPDIMGLCRNAWIGAYNYTGVMEFRGTAAATAGAAAGGRPSLLVWGRVGPGRLVLEPAFHLVTRPVLPASPGPYSIEGTTSDGARAFRLSFRPVPVADDPHGGGHFAFAVPLDAATAGRLVGIRLAGPGGVMEAVARTGAQTRIMSGAVTASRAAGAGATDLRWDAASYPAVMVRDLLSGQVLSFARGGRGVVAAGGRDLQLVLSDGVRSLTEVVRGPAR